MNNKSIKQRALVLQGGGTLGAYEVGVVNVLYHWIKKDCNENDNIFDIIAGTSIGAINAAIITSYTKERRKSDNNMSIKDSWIGVTDKLLSFWKDISSSTFLEWNPFYEAMWDTSNFMADSILKSTKYWSNLIAHSNPFFSGVINEWSNFLSTYYQIPARGETARRFYSVKQFLLLGAKNVFSPSIPKLDTKFYYNIPTLPNNIWYNYDNSMLERTLGNYVTFPIATSYYSDNYNDDVGFKEKVSKKYDNITKETNTRHILKEPRLLVVSVDIQAGATVSFDSYEYSARKCPICPSKEEDDDDKNKEDNIPTEKQLIEHVKEKHLDFVKMDGLKQLRLSKYDEHKIDSYDHTDQEKHIIFYNEGIKSEHVMASASIPIFYNYRKLVANKYHSQGEFLGKQERYFWDGQLLSNTPLRELINGHTVYWRDKIGYRSLLDEILKKDDNDNIDKNNKKLDPIESSQVPNLDVYIANIWPSKEDEVPTDHDLIMDRKNDIGNHDKTIYDEKTSELVTDYIDLCKKLITTLSTKGDSKKIIDDILKDEANSTLRDGKKRKNKDLLVGKFVINKVIRIERKDDPDSISEKWADLSKKTIDKLIKQGIEDTVRTLVIEIIKSLGIEHITDVNKEKLFNILNDVEHYIEEKRNIIYSNFLAELEKNGYDKTKLKRDSIIKSIDALIDGLVLYNSNIYESTVLKL